MTSHVHAFTDDVLADHDAMALAGLIRSGEISAAEAAKAAVARAHQVDPTLRAVQFTADEVIQSRRSARSPACRPRSRTTPTCAVCPPAAARPRSCRSRRPGPGRSQRSC
jgi:hypothetical protein